MKLNLSYSALAEKIEGKLTGKTEGKIDAVAYDSRLISSDNNLVFFALKTEQDDGHKYITEAYEKGVRCFVVSNNVNLYDDACFISVNDTLYALQTLAQKHREQFTYPVIGITGSQGKTIIKEWLYFLLKDEFNIVRSPKSYNSSLGVALSLLNLTNENNLAIIEVGISAPDEMERLAEIVDPTIGIFTGIGSAHADNFESEKEQLTEKLKLFKHVNFLFASQQYNSPIRRNKINGELTQISDWNFIDKANTPFKDNLILALKCADFFGVEHAILEEKITQLPSVASRLEILEGIQNNLIINDTYNLDYASLEQALEFLFSDTEKKFKVLILDIQSEPSSKQKKIKELVSSYPLDQVIYFDEKFNKSELQITDACILFKGTNTSTIKSLISSFTQKKHETWLEINLSAIRKNIAFFKKKLNKETKILAMLKASSYGSGDIKMAHFLSKEKIDYFGVAYSDEGVVIRKSGITKPIIVMNAAFNAFEEIIDFNLEPTIYNVKQLDEFTALLARKGKRAYPIHIKVETGMNRLGIREDELEELIDLIETQPEIRVQSVFSHLADADNIDTTYTKLQIERFKRFKDFFNNRLNYDVDYHILNSEGIINHTSYQFNMVRIGIGMYGYLSSNNTLEPAISWKTTISQIKSVEQGESIGYGRSFKAEKDMKIAILPIGYSDGFRRSLSNGKGSVYVDNICCPIVGNVCMDMTMIDITALNCQEKDTVEIIGKHQSIFAFAKQMNTIPYEVMTGISKRVKRIYISE